MSFNDVFEEGFFNTYANIEISFEFVLTAMLFSILFSLIIYAVYYFRSRKYFFSKEMAISLIALSVITTAVILTIQSSLVVSLGMVGALSIVRFRTAIKNPIDLVFLFWSLVVGIICGTGLFYIALTLTLVLGIVFLVVEDIPVLMKSKILVLDGKYPYEENLLIEILKQNTRWWKIKTRTIHKSDINLVIEIYGLKQQDTLIDQISSLDVFHDISILDQEGFID